MQIASTVRSNDAYGFPGLADGSVVATHDRLNRIVTTGGAAVAHDARGSVAAIGASGYLYDAGTINYIAYLMRCVYGEVDVCEGLGPGVTLPTEPREISSDPLS